MVVTPEQYRVMLLNLLNVTQDNDPALELTIEDLHECVDVLGIDRPIVRLPEHYLRGRKWFTGRGIVDMCNCGALWECPLAEEERAIYAAEQANANAAESADSSGESEADQPLQNQ